MPSTVAPASGVPPVGFLRRTNPARRSLAHAAHTFSTCCGKVLLRALQAPECGHPRSLAFEEQAPFLPTGSILSNLSCLGLTTQARPSARPSWLVCESCLLCSYPRRTQCLDGFYDRESVARCAANFMSGFMPDAARPRNKNNRARSLFLSTELSTGTAIENGAYFTAPLVLRGQMARETAAVLRDVDNKCI